MDSVDSVDSTDSLWGRVKQLARLGGIVAIATANLALSYCSHSPSKSDSTPADVRATPDARLDMQAPDAGPPPSDAAGAETQPPKPDARLWDVLCE